MEANAASSNDDANIDHIAQLWLEMDPEEGHEDGGKTVDQEEEETEKLAMEADKSNEGDENEDDQSNEEDNEGDEDEEEEGEEGEDDEGDEDDSADENTSSSQQTAHRASHLANLTVSPTQITLPRHEYTGIDFVDVPLEWFLEEDLPVMIGDMGMSDDMEL